MSESESIGNAKGADGREWEQAAREAAVNFSGSMAGEEAEILRELLIFGLDGNAYAIAVERVREIIRMRDLTRLPRSPDWLLGVVALRGEVVEVVDLRRRLGLPTGAVDRSTRIIVLHGDEERVAGVLVDSVSGVERVPEDEVAPAQGFESASVIEMCRRGEAFVSILDIERALEIRDD